MKIIDFKKKNFKKEQQESYENAKICYICEEEFENKYLKDKVRDNICNLKYIVSKKISIAFHNGSNHDYYFIIKESAEEFEKQLLV